MSETNRRRQASRHRKAAAIIRYTDEERDLIDRAALAKGLSREAWIRATTVPAARREVRAAEGG